jgi:hypothetical protein
MKNISDCAYQFEIQSPERSKKPQQMQPSAYTVSKKCRDSLTYQQHLQGTISKIAQSRHDTMNGSELSQQNIEERIMSHLLLNFGILNYESTKRIRHIVGKKWVENQENADAHLIFEQSLGEFFQSMNEREIKQLTQFHTNKLLLNRPRRGSRVGLDSK